MTDGTVINERRAVSTFNCIQKCNRVDLNQPLIYTNIGKLFIMI